MSVLIEFRYSLQFNIFYCIKTEIIALGRGIFLREWIYLLNLSNEQDVTQGQF